MTGYSNGAQPVSWHPSDCTCLACIDVALVEQDLTPITGWLSMRREDVLSAAQRLADETVEAARGRFPTLRDDDYLKTLADQHEDMLDWKWSIGDTDL